MLTSSYILNEAMISAVNDNGENVFTGNRADAQHAGTHGRQAGAPPRVPRCDCVHWQANAPSVAPYVQTGCR